MNGLCPEYNFAATYKVEVDSFFLRYLAGESLTLELNVAKQADFELLAQCHLPLRELLNDSGRSRHTSATLVGTRDGMVLGQIHVELRLAVPVVELFNLYLKNHPAERARLDKLRLAERELAEEEASRTRAHNQLEVTIIKCTSLRSRLGDPPSAYVGYRLLTMQDVFTPPVEESEDPVFDHVQPFPLHVDRAVLRSLQREALELIIFDDNDRDMGAGGDQGRLGTASVPLAQLAAGEPVIGQFPILYDGALGGEGGEKERREKEERRREEEEREEEEERLKTAPREEKRIEFHSE